MCPQILEFTAPDQRVYHSSENINVLNFQPLVIHI